MNAEDLCPECGHTMGGQWHKWPIEDGRCKFRDESDLTPQLVGLEGWRVEVEDINSDGDPVRPRRFYVGRSTGWRPCHLEIYNRRSRGGGPASKAYASVRKLYKR